MGSYVPSTLSQREEMLEDIGLDSLDDLFLKIPSGLKLEKGVQIPDGMPELEISRVINEIGNKNKVFDSIFRGAGAYSHYIPAIVKSIVSKEEFLTAYTPYQAEISQGILQAIFEYQTMICELTGMEVSNASVYDGATAAAEAAAMCRQQKRTKTLVSACAHPQVLETIKTYCWSAGAEMQLVPEKNGLTDLEALQAILDHDDSVAGVYIQQPNFYGNIEAAGQAADIIHGLSAKFIMGVNPIAMAVLETPGECGADIAVGEGQPLGIPLSFGGPYLGFMAVKSPLVRKLPGRIVGETVDRDGKRAFVLTLQAREQHIRREKAFSNICSNQALCALTAGAYLSVMGPEGLRQAALQSMSKAHYLAAELCKVPGISLLHNVDFFHEFVTAVNIPASEILGRLEQNGILGGLPLDERNILWCATEMNTKAEMDKLVELVKEVCRK